MLLLCCACESAPAEPTSAPLPPPAEASALTWTAPPTWNVERTADKGLYRAKYSIPPSGNAKLPAELLVTSLGRGKDADIDKKLEEFLGEWEGPGKDDVERQSMTVKNFQIRTVEIGATYRFPMGPPSGPNKKAPAHVIKEGWRGIAAGVITPDRGNWFFRLVGPNDSVAASRSAFVSLLESLQ